MLGVTLHGEPMACLLPARLWLGFPAEHFPRPVRAMEEVGRKYPISARSRSTHTGRRTSAMDCLNLRVLFWLIFILKAI